MSLDTEEDIPSNEKSSRVNLEKVIALIAAVYILALGTYIIVRGFEGNEIDDRSFSIYRTFLSLGVGVLGSTMPGFLNVKLDGPGFLIRAGGGMALFVLTFFFSPSLPGLSNSRIEIEALETVDFRTVEVPSSSESKRLAADTAITIPISIRNSQTNGKTSYLENSEATLELNGKLYEFNWRFFVNMHREGTKWLSIVDDADVEALIGGGEVKNLEILHVSGPASVSWNTILNELKDEIDPNGKLAHVYITLTIDGSPHKKKCVFDLEKWQNEIINFESKYNRTPGRVTVDCREVS